MFTRKISLKDRFLSKVNKTDSCWLWIGHKVYAGYGAIFCGVTGKGNIPAHRASWMIYKGEIPNKLWVLHKCDNPACVNPEHLFLGTCQDNVADMIKKGRKVSNPPKGEKSNFAKFSNDQIKMIRNLYKSKNILLREFAQLFNVDAKTIGRIIRKDTYKNE
jgi:hypothetical protein